MKRLVLMALAAAFTAPVFAAKYEIDPTHTQIQFGYSHFGFSNITGRFDQVTGQFELDTANLAKSSISIEIPVSSISNRTCFPWCCTPIVTNPPCGVWRIALLNRFANTCRKRTGSSNTGRSTSPSTVRSSRNPLTRA